MVKKNASESPTVVKMIQTLKPLFNTQLTLWEREVTGFNPLSAGSKLPKVIDMFEDEDGRGVWLVGASQRDISDTAVRLVPWANIAEVEYA